MRHVMSVRLYIHSYLKFLTENVWPLGRFEVERRVYIRLRTESADKVRILDRTNLFTNSSILIHNNIYVEK